MITTCTGCQTRYRLDDARVPRRRIRVRCPRCEAIFALDGAQAGARVAPPQESLEIERSSGGLFSGAPSVAAAEPALPAREPTAWTTRPQPAGTGAFVGPARPAAAPSAPSQAPAMKRPAAPSPLAAEAPTASASAVLAGPSVAEIPEAPADGASADADGRPRRDRDKARRLARALVSDILVYNRESRDRALSEGNLIQALGPEIKKSWELYKERVTPEVANSTSHFRDALNEILAEGRKVF